MKKAAYALIYLIAVLGIGIVALALARAIHFNFQDPHVSIELPDAEPEEALLSYYPAYGILLYYEPDEYVPDEYEYDIVEEEPELPRDLVTITISAAGDVTLGGDPRGAGMFMSEFNYHDQDHSHFLRYVSHVFEESDLSIVNLEGTLTYAEAHRDRTFVFRGPPHFARILSSSGVDVVTLANNHTMDFFERGHEDTRESLAAEGIAYFGDSIHTILEVNGIYVGLFGFNIWYDGRGQRNRIAAAIEDLQDRGAQLIIAYYHWGVELANTPEHYQRDIGRFTIASGAHLVLGAHSHVLQGIEVYRDRNIVYSLANFSFGGNNNPQDHHTMIFQQTFAFDDGVLVDTNDTNIIPAFISSVRYRNNFQPVIATGEDAELILERIREYSSWLVD